MTNRVIGDAWNNEFVDAKNLGDGPWHFMLI